MKNSFLYFVETEKKVSSLKIVSGLPYLVSGVSSARAISCGPSGSSGIVFVPNEFSFPSGYLVFEKSGQQWSLMERLVTFAGLGECRVWVGVWKDRKPTPDDLKFCYDYDCHFATLSDGADWHVPILQHYNKKLGVEVVYKKGPDGVLVARPRDKYADLCDVCSRLFDRIYGQLARIDEELLPEPLEVQEMLSFACSCLSLVYRMGDDEIYLLELLTNHTLFKVLSCAIDLPSIIRMSQDVDNKKKVLQGTASS